MDARFEVREVRWEVRACDSSEAMRLKIMFCLDWRREPMDSEGGTDEWTSMLGFSGEETKFGLTV